MSGSYATIQDQPALRFERRLAHPIDVVWRAITEPDELVARLESVEATQVSELAAQLLTSGLRAAVVGPFRSETRFEKAIAV